MGTACGGMAGAVGIDTRGIPKWNARLVVGEGFWGNVEVDGLSWTKSGKDQVRRTI